MEELRLTFTIYTVGERKKLKLSKFTVIFDFWIQSFTNGQPSEQPVEMICSVKLKASVDGELSCAGILCRTDSVAYSWC